MKLSTVVLMTLISLGRLSAQFVPSQATNPQEPAPPSIRGNPFEPVPEPAQLPKELGPTIETIEFRGARRVLQPALRAVIASREGGVYSFERLRRDSQDLYNTGRYSNVAWETELVPAGVVVRFVVVERPLIREIEIQGDDTITLPEISERFKQRKVKLQVDTLYDDEELERAVAAIREVLGERGRHNITITPDLKSIWPHSTVTITFRVEKTL